MRRTHKGEGGARAAQRKAVHCAQHSGLPNKQATNECSCGVGPHPCKLIFCSGVAAGIVEGGIEGVWRAEPKGNTPSFYGAKCVEHANNATGACNITHTRPCSKATRPLASSRTTTTTTAATHSPGRVGPSRRQSAASFVEAFCRRVLKATTTPTGARLSRHKCQPKNGSANSPTLLHVQLSSATSTQVSWCARMQPSARHLPATSLTQ